MSGRGNRLRTMAACGLCAMWLGGGLPLAVEAQEPAGPDPLVSPVSVDEVVASEAEPTVEVVSERTETTKTFETDVPGVMVTEVYAEPVHFEDPVSGVMVEIDATLEPAVGGGVETAAAPVTVGIAADATEESMVSVDFGDGASASFGVEDAVAVPAEVSTAGDLVTFDGVVEDASVTLEPTGSGVKETIILDSPDAPTIWRFPLDLDGLVASIDPEWGHVLLHAADDLGGEPVAMVPHGWMVDAAFGTNPDEAASYSEGVVYTLEDTPEGLVLVVAIDEVWLGDPDRVWPVSVDPTLVQVDAAADDTFVTPYVNTPKAGEGYFYAGSLGIFVNHAYLHVDTSSVTGKVIHYAAFNALQTNGATCASTNVDLYRVTTPWVGAGMTWTQGQPAVDPYPVTTTYTTHNATTGSGCTAPEWAVWGVSDLVREWAEAPTTNNGISLRAPAGQGLNPNFWKKFSSANATWKPHLHVIWSEPGAAGAPDVPTDLQPSGAVGDAYVALSATFTDPDGDQGHVRFEIYDETTNQLLAVAEGTTVASGASSTWTPTTPAEFDRPYRIEAHAIDEDDNWSLDRAVTTSTVELPVVAGPDPDDIVFHDEILRVENLESYGVSSVDFYAGSSLVGSDTDGVDGWSVVWDTTGGGDGDYALTASANTASGSYASASLPVTVNNGLDGPDRVAVDLAQERITIDEFAVRAISVQLDHDGVGERYLTPVGPGDEATVPVGMLYATYWPQLGSAAQTTVTSLFDPPLLEPAPINPTHIGAYSLREEPGDDSVYDDCSDANLRWGRINTLNGVWCHTTYEYSGAEANIPDLDFYYTVGNDSDYGDVDPTHPVSGSFPGGTTTAATVPEYIRDAADNTFRALEVYSRDLDFVLPEQFMGSEDPLALTIVVADERGFANPGHEEHSITLPSEDPHAAPRHEVFHLFQYNYVELLQIWPGDAGWWFLEAAAEWADHQVVEIEDLTTEPSHYAQALPTVLAEPHHALTTHAPPGEVPFVGDDEDNRRGYGSFILAEYLDQHVSPVGFDNVVLRVYERLALTQSDTMEVLTDVLEDEGTPWAGLLPSYWAAAYLLTPSPSAPAEVSFRDDDVGMWRSTLAGGSSALAGDSFSAKRRAARGSGPTVLSDTSPNLGPFTSEVWPGGAQFFDISLDAGIEGTVTPSVRVDASDFDSADTAALRGTWIAYDHRGYPNLCFRDGAAVATSAFEDGLAANGDPIAVWEAPIRLDERCPTATLVITHVDPTHEDANEIPVTIELELGDIVAYQDDDFDDDFGEDLGGDAGRTTLDGYDRVIDLLVQPDGRVVALLDRYDDSDIILVRLTPDGHLDASFGDSGTKVYPGSSNLHGYALGYDDQPGGTVNDQIVAAATSDTGEDTHLRVIWFDTFGDVESTDTYSNESDLAPRGFIVDANGRPVFAADAVGEVEATVVRWDPASHDLDASFGSGGVVTIATGTDHNVLRGIAQVGDRYVLAGRSKDVGEPGITFSVERLWALATSTGDQISTAPMSETCGIDASEIVPTPSGNGFVVSRYNGGETAYYHSFQRYNQDLSLDTTWEEGCAETEYEFGILASDSSGRLYFLAVEYKARLGIPLQSTLHQAVPPGVTGQWTGGAADTGDTEVRIHRAAPQTITVGGPPVERMVIAGSDGPNVFIGRFNQPVGG